MSFFARAAGASGLILLAGALATITIHPPETERARRGAAEFIVASLTLTTIGAAGAIADS